MYSPREERAQSRFNRLMTAAVVVLAFAAMIWAGMYGIELSQLATPDNGPVKFYWVIHGAKHGCLVLEKGKRNRDCSEFTYDELQHYPMHYEDPHVSFSGYFTK